MDIFDLPKFLEESNRIEGITKPVLNAEIRTFKTFLELPVITVADLQTFVGVFQPDAVLHERVGLNVRVGNYMPSPGGPLIRQRLMDILDKVNIEPRISSPHNIHLQYEHLHPFTDGNGRSGRALWAWQMKKFPLGFLHTFYYQTLQAYHADL